MKKPIPSLTKKKEVLILDVAHQRFSHYGFSKVTIDEIAADVGMGKASLYYYFPTKEELFRRVVEREREEFLAHMHQVIAKEVSSHDKLMNYLDLRLELSAQLFNLLGASHRTGFEWSASLKKLSHDFSFEERKLLTAILKHGKTTGEFTLQSPEKVAALLVAVLQGLRMRVIHLPSTAANAKYQHDSLKNDSKMFMQLVIQGMLQHSQKISRKAQTV
jgi:TetR/AcrR family transcriptional regulator